MAGKPNKKWHETMLKKFNGDEEALRQHLSELGRKGGKKGRTGGFYANRDFASRVGRIGGQKSSRKGIKNGEGK